MLDLILKARTDVLSGSEISYKEALRLTEVSFTHIPYLAAAANEVRQKFVGDKVESCALSNIKSGHCSEDCKFCAQSGHYKTDSPVYPQIGVEEIVSQAKQAEQMGATEFCLVSSGWGATSDREFETVLEAVRRISTETKLFADCSLGFLTGEQMRQLKEAGLYRNNHNLEAAKGYFENVCTTHTHEERMSHIQRARHYGIHPCSGGILGMGESPKDRIDLAFELKKIGVDCVPINILNPRRGTPLGDVEPLPPLEIIKYIAIYRMILPKSTIKIAGGREVNLRDLQAMAMQAGANGLIIGNYLTTMGRNPAQDIQMLKDLGFKVATSAGPAQHPGSPQPASKASNDCAPAGCHPEER
ncbi:MAG: biotin synthase BioB [Omnitrophica bacterium RIFCSPHIGHO2_02_FULL_51_18]|nr:MAG: biotin synthase BioB [Omnitrophica bacterium RIFCSPHIGHO2_02_FULL_51_18]